MSFLRIHSRTVPKPALTEESFAQALKKVYPDCDLQELNIPKALRVINDVALRCKGFKTPFCIIPKTIKDTDFEKIKGLGSLAGKVKLYVFSGKKDTMAVFLHLRGRDDDIVKGKSKTAAKGVFLDLSLNHPGKSVVSTHIRLTRKDIEKGGSGDKHKTPPPGKTHANEVEFLTEFQNTDFVPRLLRHASLCRKKAKSEYTKFYIFEELFDKDFFALFNELKEDRIKFTQDETRQIAIRLINGLYNFHRRKILHGGIHPESILIKKEGANYRPSLCDLSYASKLKDASEKITQTATFPAYVSPEMYREWVESGGSKTPTFGIPSEVWAMGCVIHYLVKGSLSTFSLFQESSFDLTYFANFLAEEAQQLVYTNPLTDSPPAKRGLRQSDYSGSFTEEEGVLSTHFEPKSYIASAMSMDHGSMSSRSFTEQSQSTPSPIPLKLHHTKAGGSKIVAYVKRLENLGTLLDTASGQLNVLQKCTFDAAAFENELRNAEQFRTTIGEINKEIRENLLDGPLIDQLQGKEPPRELLSRYKTMSDRVKRFNDRLTDAVLTAAESRKERANVDDPLMNIVTKMLNTAEAGRISLKEALKELQHHFPEDYRRAVKLK